MFNQSRYSVRKSIIERFLSKIKIIENHCWEWTGYTNHHRYGCFGVKNKSILSHRYIYEYYYGMICPDLTIDHLCRNRKCVNPIHLEQVSMKINNERGMSPSGINSRKTHCIRGHEFTEDNTYQSDGRRCKTCRLHRNEIQQQNGTTWRQLHRIENNKKNREIYHINKQKINARKRELYRIKREEVQYEH